MFTHDPAFDSNGSHVAEPLVAKLLALNLF
jgi:hypothetical protein